MIRILHFVRSHSYKEHRDAEREGGWSEVRKSLVDLDALVAELVLRLLNLAKERLIRLRRVVEAEEAEAERGERVRAKSNEKPPRDLLLAFDFGTTASHHHFSTSLYTPSLLARHRMS